MKIITRTVDSRIYEVSNKNFECTDMYLQRDSHYNSTFDCVCSCDDCYVYECEDGSLWIQSTSNAWKHVREFEDETIPLIPLQGQDLEVIKFRYEF